MDDSQIRQTVLDRWPEFKALGWKSPSQAIGVYTKNRQRFDDDMIAVMQEGSAARRAEQRQNEQQDTNRKIAETCAHMRELYAQGFTIEEIHETVPCWFDKSGWAYTSIEHIVSQKIPAWQTTVNGMFKRMPDAQPLAPAPKENT